MVRCPFWLKVTATLSLPPLRFSLPPTHPAWLFLRCFTLPRSFRTWRPTWALTTVPAPRWRPLCASPFGSSASGLLWCFAAGRSTIRSRTSASGLGRRLVSARSGLRARRITSPTTSAGCATSRCIRPSGLFVPRPSRRGTCRSLGTCSPFVFIHVPPCTTFDSSVETT